MNEDDLSEVHHEHRLAKRTLWQRWMAWSGSFLVLSILLHVLLLGGATVLIVQVVQSRKEKLKFTAPPPSANASAEHKVKPSKKTAAAAPAISKRITTTAANANIALPAMELNSTGPDVMASVMSGMGASGLGSGAGGGAAGMASMPVSGLTAFGFKGAQPGGLKGYFYDLKQTADRKPTPLADKTANSGMDHWKIFDEFFSKDWDDKVLDQYYKAKDPMVTYQIYIPVLDAKAAPKAFGVENEVKPSHWVIVYKGNVTAPRDGTFRFRGYADDVLAVRFDNQNVFYQAIGNSAMNQKYMKEKYFKPTIPPTLVAKGQPNPDKIVGKGYLGNWFSVQAGKTYPIEVLISEVPGGAFMAWLQIEERYPEKPYPHRTLAGLTDYCAYPLFAVKKGVPLTQRHSIEEPNLPDDLKQRFDRERSPEKETAPELAPDPVIFLSK